MDKTVKVRFRNTNWNRHVSKFIVSHKNMLVHDELNKCREGDVVRVQYVRPLSARKSWAVAEFMRLKGTSWEKYQQEIPNEVKRDEIAKLNEFEKLRQLRTQSHGESPEVASARKGEPTKVKLDVVGLRDEISELSSKLADLSFFGEKARRIMKEDPKLAMEILVASGKEPKSESMKRNIIRRHLVKNKSA